MRGERSGHTLQATALVHEAYMKLVDQREVEWQDRSHFFAYAARAMRAVLESAGVHNVLAKSKGSSNPHNVVKATFRALTTMRDAYSIAKNRGVSLSKVFNG